MKAMHNLPGTVALALLATGVQAQAPGTQSSEYDSAAIEEVIVTANRREQNLQEVAVSVAAFTSDFFKDSGTYNLKQL